MLGIVCLSMMPLGGCSGHRSSPVPLVRAHAHNDYLHRRPLLDALDCGFCSVEADVHLVDGELLVGHKLQQVRPGLTLQSLYLDPLKKRIAANGGRVYRDGPQFDLLIDIKGNPEATYAKLREVLRKYEMILTSFDDAGTHRRAVTVIATGDQPRAMLAAERSRFLSSDGHITDLQTDPPTSLISQISARWIEEFAWRGDGPMHDADRTKLLAIVRLAHEQGRRVRFWDAPDNPLAWQVLLDAGVDLINTDDLRGLRDFLLRRRAAG